MVLDCGQKHEAAVNSSCGNEVQSVLEKCLQVKQQLLGPDALIEIKSQSEISFQSIALLRR
jgi:hypothetical protein